MANRSLPLLTLVLIALLVGMAGQSGWVTSAKAAGVDIAHSRVSIVFRTMATPVEAPFRRFSATIDYDAAKPEAAKAEVAIDTGSLDLGEPDFSKAVAQKEWLDVARFPSATFVSSSIKASAGNTLMAFGRLMIKGKAADISFPVAVKAEKGTHVFEGKIPIRRLDFNVGEGEWRDTNVVADEVVITFRLVLTR